jgi:hypothetical protein
VKIILASGVPPLAPELEVNAVVKKPYDPAELAVRIKKLLGFGK